MANFPLGNHYFRYKIGSGAFTAWTQCTVNNCTVNGNGTVTITGIPAGAIAAGDFEVVVMSDALESTEAFTVPVSSGVNINITGATESPDNNWTIIGDKVRYETGVTIPFEDDVIVYRQQGAGTDYVGLFLVKADDEGFGFVVDGPIRGGGVYANNSVFFGFYPENTYNPSGYIGVKKVGSVITLVGSLDEENWTDINVLNNGNPFNESLKVIFMIAYEVTTAKVINPKILTL
jgi:hypothetical protein